MHLVVIKKEIVLSGTYVPKMKTETFEVVVT